MKKFLLLAGLALGLSPAYAQDQHPNSDFEDWTDFDGYMLPDSLASFENICASINNVEVCREGLERTTDANTGTYAMKLTNKEDASGDPTPVTVFSLSDDFGAITFTGRPDSLSGSYKFLQEGQDTASVYVYLLKEGVADPFDFDENTDLVAAGFVEWRADATEYTQFYVPLTYLSDDPVANIMIVASNSEDGDGTLGTTLYLDSFEFIYGAVTSDEEMADAGLELFPNPVQDMLNINGDFNKVEILSMEGETVLTSTDSQINLSELNAGIYIAQIHTDNSVLPKKIIVD